MTWDPKDDIYKLFAETPDKELQEWEKFVTIRQNEFNRLAQGVMRRPADLVLHEQVKVRPNREWQQVIQDAEFSKKPLYRSCHYEEKNRLKPYQCKVYALTKTKLERGIHKVIERIDYPDYIKKTELGLAEESKRNPCVKLEADFEQYKDQRQKALKKRIEKFEPFKPEIKELVVIGKKPKWPPPPPPIPPNLTFTAPPAPPAEAPSGIYALRINNTVFVKDIPNQRLSHLKRLQKEPWHEVRDTWTYYLNNPQTRLGEAKLFLQNLGTVAIKYCWQKLQKLIPFIPEYTYEQKFFFNKGENVINPGQSRTIYFTLVSDMPGIYLETWKLNLINVSFLDNPTDKLTFELIGDSAENMKKISNRIEKMHYRIIHKATRKFANDYICEILDKVVGVKHEYYPYKKYLLEAEMFVNINQFCYYHQTQVQQMKELYTEMTGEVWDLSIPTWRRAMIEKPFDERMLYYDQLKKFYITLLKPWREGDDILEQKYRAVTLLLGKLADKFYDVKIKISKWNGAENTAPPQGNFQIQSQTRTQSEAYSQVHKEMFGTAVINNRLTNDVVRNTFFIHMYDHVAYTMELIAATVSSIDMYRWIDFDFCQN